MGCVFRVLCSLLLLVLFLSAKVTSYEKTLRKIVRNQSKMVQRPFSENVVPTSWQNTSINSIRYNDAMPFSGVSQMKTLYHIPRAKISSLKTGRTTSTFSKVKIMNKDPSNERLARNTFSPLNITRQQKLETPKGNTGDHHRNINNMTIKNFYQIPTQSRYFPAIEDSETSYEHEHSKEDTVVIPPNRGSIKDNRSFLVQGILAPQSVLPIQAESASIKNDLNETHSIIDIDPNNEKPDFVIEGLPMDSRKFSYNLTDDPFVCIKIKESKADIDAQDKFSRFDIEPWWVPKKHFWNNIFDRRYESLMRDSKWPQLKVILVPRVHVDSIWKKTFEQYHKESVSKILTNIVKKLQFYDRLTFTWNEVSHLSQWWKTASHRTRSAFRKLLKGGRLEITTGGWIEPDESTTHIFGLVHQLIEGHQWLKLHLNYTPKVAWLSNSVTHSPTMAYLLSAVNIHQLVFTNLHYSWQEFLAEYQYSDFIWIQNWDHDISESSQLNDDFQRIGKERFPKHAILSHYLQYNSADYKACGPNSAVCSSEYNFVGSDKNIDVNTYNIKEKAEKLLEQYSKTGTISLHNTIIAPLGGPYCFEEQPEFDYQYNNYLKIADFINVNKDLYKATINFGTAKDYFHNVMDKRVNYPTLKGDFLNFADIESGNPAYWTGFYTSRPFTKILLRRLQSTLRTTEILFSLALNVNVFRGFNLSTIFELLLKTRENVARLLDRNVVSGTVSASALKYVHNQILSSVKDCWYIQELSASFFTLKTNSNTPNLQKYVYRDGEFISVFRSISPGDQIYIFNSLSHERTEIVEIVTRYPNVRVLDHDKKDVVIQINPMWKYSSDNLIRLSRRFFKISFVVVVSPMTFVLYQVKETYDASHNAAAIYCSVCMVDQTGSDKSTFLFNVQPIQSGDIQLESYKHRLMFDEVTGFLKTIVEKESNTEKTVFIDYGAFRDSSFNSGMFLFNTNVTKPLQDILSSFRLGKKSKLIFIISGQVTTELITIYGRLLQHTTKIFNLLNGPLSNAIYIESKVDYEMSPKNRELEMFLSIQTDIANGNPPKIFIDNNGFQYTSRVLNISRRVESNMYPITTMAFIQDKRSRLTFITDHAQGVTALQEGQIVVMLDRRILFADGRGPNEGLADSSATCHRHYIYLENFIQTTNHVGQLVLPSLNAFYLSNTLNNLLDIFFVEQKHTALSYYMYLPLIKAPFPCDVFIVNYRIVLNKVNLQRFTATSALMILHRQSFSCQLSSSSSIYCQGDSTFAVDKLLRNVKGISKTNLAGTNDGEKLSELNLVNFPPMELLTLRIDF